MSVIVVQLFKLPPPHPPLSPPHSVPGAKELRAESMQTDSHWLAYRSRGNKKPIKGLEKRREFEVAV